MSSRGEVVEGPRGLPGVRRQVGSWEPGEWDVEGMAAGAAATAAAVVCGCGSSNKSNSRGVGIYSSRACSAFYQLRADGGPGVAVWRRSAC